MRLKQLTPLILSIALAGAIFTGTASAAGCDTYVGSSGGNWGTAANWSSGSVPTADDDVCINGDTTVVFTPYVTGGQQIYADTVNSVTLGSGATLAIEGENSNYGGDYYAFTQLYVNNSLTVDSGATLLLDSTATAANTVPAGDGPGGEAELFVDVDRTSGTSPELVNDGTITAEEASGTDFGEYIQAPIENAGSIDDASGMLTLQDKDEATENSGTLSVAGGATTQLAGGPGFTNTGQVTAGGTLEMNANETWTQSGGSVTGTTVSLAYADTLADSSGAASFLFTAGQYASAISGTIPSNQTVTVDAGTSGNANNIIDIDGTVTNDGTLVMNTVTGATGNPEFDSGPSGGTLVNNGTLDLIDPITTQSNFLRVNTTNDASGVIDVESGFAHYDGGDTLTNSGTLTIAPGAQFEQQGGVATNTGTLAPQIASGTSDGQYDLYGGTFNGGGSISPTLVGGFVPTAGQEFVVVNFGNSNTFTGTFSGGNGFSVDLSKAYTAPGDVGVIYGAAPTAPPTTTSPTPTPTPTPTPAPVATRPPAGTLSLGKSQIVSRKLEFTLTCPAGHICAAYAVTATVVEHLKGKQITSVSALRRDARTTTKTVTVATARGTVAGGRTVIYTLKLNAAGAALLKRYGKLKVLVTVTEGGKKLSTRTVTLTEPKAVKKKPVTKP